MEINLKKIKNVIIFLILIVVLIISVMIYTSIKQKEVEEQLETDFKLELEDNLKEVSNLELFNKLQKNINCYLEILNSENYTAIYSLLDKTFVEKYRINENNIFEYLEKNEEEIHIVSMYELEVRSDIITYFIYYNNIRNTKKYKIIVNYDYSNNTYSVCPFGFMYEGNIKYDNIKGTLEILDIEKIRNSATEIKSNAYNKM